MPLLFPDLDTLKLALTTGAVPAAVAQAPLQAGFDDARVWVNTAASLPRNAQLELKKLNVETARVPGSVAMADYTCWPQVFALERSGDRSVPAAQVPVLFELPGEQLSSLVAEMLRLGNDRQSFRHLEAKGEGPPRVLLRVFGPPYYTLLRAIDRAGAGPVAYLEAAPRVWVELGFTHPFAKQLKAPEGKLLLLRPPRQWQQLDEGPYREIYEILEFPLPAAKSPWKDGEPEKRLQVPLRLKPAGASDTAELWVLRERPVEQLDALVAAADDQRLRQLSFAAAVKDGKQLIVLRVRPSKQAPPVVVVDGIAYRSYLKLPNLFLPSGSVLNPPLRRDAVRKLLAADPGVLTWLHPSGDGKFVPETLPDTAFRPLSDWVDYVLDHHQEALKAWVQAAQFDFEPFVCGDDSQPKPKKPPADKGDRKGARPPDKGDAPPVVATGRKKEVAPAADADEFTLVKTEPSILERERAELEEKFKALGGPLDSPERMALWPEMAVRNAALGNGDDAGLCWMSSFWSSPAVTVGAAAQWFRAEVGRDAVKPKADGLPGRSIWAGLSDVAAGDLDRLLALASPTRADVRALAAYLFWSARRERPPEVLLSRLGKVRRFLEEYESHLPIRAAWLAWTSLVQASTGDVLGLARTRDRLLERLFHDGLKAEQDMPSFLRAPEGPNNERFRAFRTWMVGLAEQARNWVARLKSKEGYTNARAATEAYADLLFAFGLARLGESDASKALLARGVKGASGKDPGHQVLLDAFTYRIEQALAGQPHAGPLPDAVLRDAQGLEMNPRYAVDRLRQELRVLEPAQQIDPYRHILGRRDALERELAEITDLADRTELASRFAALLEAHPSDADRPRVLKVGLALAPRVGEEFALRVLARLGPCLDGVGEAGGLKSVDDVAKLIERGLFAAAHFDRSEHVQTLVERFHKLLRAQKSPAGLEFIETAAAQLSRGLRKLGMRDEIDRLLDQMARTVVGVMQAKSVGDLFAAAAKAGGNPDLSRALRTLLHVASGWLYFEQERLAQPILDAARSLLLAKTLEHKHQGPLACAYVYAIGQAPPEVVQKRIDELFRSLEGVYDNFTTNTYYSRFQLLFVEAVVQAVVTDDLTRGANVRRWLDDDEFLVRQRIHRDLRSLMAQHE